MLCAEACSPPKMGDVQFFPRIWKSSKQLLRKRVIQLDFPFFSHKGALTLRARIIFRLRNKGAVLPFHHQHILTALIQDFTKDFVQSNGKQEVFYNFSGLKGQTRVSRHGLNYYSSRVTLVLSSPHKHFIDFFVRNLFSQQLIEVGSLILAPETVEMEQPPKFEEEVKYLSISPIVLSVGGDDSPGKEFILPESDAFSDLLYDSTMSRMERSGMFSPEEIAKFYKFQIIPDTAYIQKINTESKKFARIYGIYEKENKMEVRGYTIPFALYAHPTVQQFVFECGMGEATHHGYGMVDLAHSDPTARATPYDLTGLNIRVVATSFR
jgi:CRISPR-associated endoribonuclease Cas6